MDVPDMLAVAVVELEEKPAETIETPGANQSTHVPKFDHFGLVSVLSVAPIVMAVCTRAGEYLQASCPIPACRSSSSTTTTSPRRSARR